MAERTGIAWCDHTFNPWICPIPLRESDYGGLTYVRKSPQRFVAIRRAMMGKDMGRHTGNPHPRDTR